MNKYYIEKATGLLFFVLYETSDILTLVNDENKTLNIRKCMIDKWFLPY